jgi:hypothetical protein
VGFHGTRTRLDFDTSLAWEALSARNEAVRCMPSTSTSCFSRRQEVLLVVIHLTEYIPAGNAALYCEVEGESPALSAGLR